MTADQALAVLHEIAADDLPTATEETIAMHPAGSDPDRHATETQQIAEVFGLTGGELSDTPWVEPDGFASYWWYEGVPEWAEEDHAVDSHEYRTSVRDIMFGTPTPEGWEHVASYRSSGECECRHEDFGIAGQDCPLCEGDGFIYLGDGWAEVVYRRTTHTAATDHDA